MQRSTKIYLWRKACFAASALFFVVSLTFFLMKAIPGDPFQQDEHLPAEVHRALQKHYGLDRPLWEQYALYLQRALVFDFGPSLVYKNRSVNQIIKDGFPTSALLGCEAFFLAILGGLCMGSGAALYKQRWQGKALLAAAALATAMPSFVIAAILQYVFAYRLGWLPVARWGTLAHTILPALALALVPMAFIARLIYANLTAVLQQSYMKTAQLKGLSPFIILVRHALRNACLPMLGYLGIFVANLVTGGVVVEKIFAIPGLGQWFVTSIAVRDYPLIMGITVFYSVVLLLASTLSDLVYAYFDPRIMQEKHAH